MSLVERLAGEGLSVSVDTWKPGVARAALAAGLTMVNDVQRAALPGGGGRLCGGGRGARDRPYRRRSPSRRRSALRQRRRGGRHVPQRADRPRARPRRGAHRALYPGLDPASRPPTRVAALRALPRAGRARPSGPPGGRARTSVGAITGRSPADRLAGTLAASAWWTPGPIRRVHDAAATADDLAWAVPAALRGEAQVPGELRLDPSLRRAVCIVLLRLPVPKRRRSTELGDPRPSRAGAKPARGPARHRLGAGHRGLPGPSPRRADRRAPQADRGATRTNGGDGDKGDAAPVRGRGEPRWPWRGGRVRGGRRRRREGRRRPRRPIRRWSGGRRQGGDDGANQDADVAADHARRGPGREAGRVPGDDDPRGEVRIGVLHVLPNGAASCLAGPVRPLARRRVRLAGADPPLREAVPG